MIATICCIAKNEDCYIDEWLDYHTKLGFDRIYVYQNGWRYSGNRSLHPNTVWIEFDGDKKQLAAYTDFADHRSEECDFCAFIDVDEFLTFTNGIRNVKQWLEGFRDQFAVGVNWRLFGDSGLTDFDRKDMSVVKRFVMCESVQNKHIKTIVNFAKVRRSRIGFVQPADPHSFRIGGEFRTKTSDNINLISGPFNTNFDKNVQLNHYYCKTRPEFETIKLCRGRADLSITENGHFYKNEAFDGMNKNEVQDLSAKNFMFGNG